MCPPVESPKLDSATKGRTDKDRMSYLTKMVGWVSGVHGHTDKPLTLSPC